ncbi:hypothetical protein DAPPUDRAFT_310310 [Daphnia pulex]|uniref:Uncharacterized protein n=1 Tax=Daphnia pulex TaxID=6669 RepID=E9FT76_DAPPU|nr:hypothetical protein DAPPUDRAFT_310310 [Daphnia pulex]|eukprot:EFX89325.1 hypothetical protein DAPPUDRAFT_310310 [Daphnia pulex]
MVCFELKVRLRLCHRNQLSPKIVCNHIRVQKCEMFVFASSMGRPGCQVKMTSEICDVDDSVKEMSSSSTTDSQMPLMEDHRSESATTSTQIHDLTDEHDGGDYHFLTFTRNVVA